MSGRRTSIDDAAFAYLTRKSGEVEISYHGRPVTTLRAEAAAGTGAEAVLDSSGRVVEFRKSRGGPIPPDGGGSTTMTLGERLVLRTQPASVLSETR